MTGRVARANNTAQPCLSVRETESALSRPSIALASAAARSFIKDVSPFQAKKAFGY